jgi:hypothetical protein
MITVGFGDILPNNWIEIIFVMVQMVLSCGVFAYAINSIGYIFS